jgi:hypothetical protein
MEMLGNADLSEKILNSVYFITILHTNPGKLSTAATAPPPLENMSPVSPCI